MRTPTVHDWKKWKGSFARLPAVAAFPNTSFPDSWLSWTHTSPFSALLETGKAGRHTIFTPRINRIFVCAETSSSLLRLEYENWLPEQTFHGHPIEILRTWIQKHRAPRLPDLPVFTGGLIGFFSYDFARLLEKLPIHARPDLEIPPAAFAIASKSYVYDHDDHTLFCIVSRDFTNLPIDSDHSLEIAFYEANEEARLMKTEWDTHAIAPPPHPPPPETVLPGAPQFSFSRDGFMEAVHRVQDYIRSGDTYQTNLSIRETRPLQATPEAIYEKLRRINPSPYMALLRLPGFSLVSGSPELLVKLQDNKLEARPIAGTRPRGIDSAEDQDLNRDLIGSSKERAEHLMLVDLIRNDLGRVSTFGSVRVTEFMTVESYSHVMHIVSHIEGELADGKDLFDAIAATFPGGTITGAPKVRTMEIIEELEPVRRGPYTGSIGWIGFSGDMELNITIRTLLALNGEAHVQAGAGIVIDSDPAHEYQESVNKALALWAAVEAAEADLTPLSARADR